MNREAVALGTPVFTTFTGRMGGVDEALIADGRLQVLADPAALELRKRDSPVGVLHPRDAAPLVDGALGGCRGAVERSLGIAARRSPVAGAQAALWHVTTTDAVFAFLLAAAIAWLLVPYAERLAFRVGAIDQPKPRGLHNKPMPRLSGLAILVAVEAAGWIWLPGEGESRSILLGAVAIAAVGVVDDVRGLAGASRSWSARSPPRSIPVLAGVRVDNLTLPFVGGFELGWLAYPLTVLGIVAVVNVINFLDGVDGLAAGVCTIAAITLAAIALSLERNAAGVLAALTAGAALGFLRHGFPPASSFMGDTGSNLLGYLLAIASVQGALKTNAVIALAFPLIVLAVPILDTGFVVAKRLKYRQPIYQADSWHFHHRMANIGFSQRRTVTYLYAWTLVMAALALALRFVPYSDNHGHFDLFWSLVMGVADPARARRQRLSGLRAGDRQAAPRPDQSGDRGIRGDRRCESDDLVTGCDNPHESASESQLSGPFGYSRLSARPPEEGGFYVSSQVRRPTAAGRRSRSLSAGRAAPARLRRRAPLPGWPSAASRRSPSAAPRPSSSPATARRRWGSSPRPRSAASG